MFSLNSMLQSLTPSKLVSNLTSNYNKLREKIAPPQIAITEIVPNIFHMDFPQLSNIEQICVHISNSPYTVWNISEYDYEDSFGKGMVQRNKEGELKHLHFQLYNNLPFHQLVLAIREVEGAVGRKRKVYVHCQEGKVRSAVFLSSYLFVTASLGLQDISQAIHHVNKKLGISLQSKGTTYKNQHTLFRNLVNYTTNRHLINKHRLELQRISINNAPKVKEWNGSAQVVLQIRCGREVVHKCIYKQEVREGEAVSLSLGKSKRVLLGDQFLIIVKYLHKKTLYNMLRIQSNTNFIFNNFARVHQHDIDLSPYCAPQQQHTFIDLTFTSHPSLSLLSSIHQHPPKDNNTKNWNLLSGQGLTDSGLYPPQQDRFDLFLGEEEEIDDNQLKTKIEEVIKNMTRKQEERDLDREEEEQDLDDYLVKLQSQAD